MAIKATPFSSDLPVPPGSVLKDEIDFRGITQKELANRMGRPQQAISEIVNGKKAVTAETALELERVLGIKAHIWVNLEAGYRLTLARNEENAKLKADLPLLKLFHVGELEKRGWIQDAKKRIDKVKVLRKFLDVPSLAGIKHDNTHAAAFRMTGTTKHSPQSLAVWLRKGELDAAQIDTADYDGEKFSVAVSKIRELTTEPPDKFVPKMRRLCADAGVALVLTQELPKSGANGATRWLPNGKPLIQLSLRWRWADIFWFTFFHEAAHVLNHQDRPERTFINYSAPEARNTPEEQEADKFAADELIPPVEWQDFRERRMWSRSSITDFAVHLGIHPGIVVGRLEHEKLVNRGRHNAIKMKYVWA